MGFQWISPSIAVARPLLITRLVVSCSAIETIFQYRTLIGKCELGVGLDWDEIQQITDIESELVLDGGSCGRRYKRQDVDLSGICLLYTSPSPRDGLLSRMPSSA